MKVIILFFILFSHLGASASKIDINWSEDFDKSLHIKCEGDPECERYFFDEQSVEEEICDNCFSNDLQMTFLFNSIGKELSRGEKVTSKEFFRFIFMRQFISIDYNSPYDLVTNSSVIAKKIKFRKLCEYYTQEPIIFYSRTYFNHLSKPKFIFCGDSIYRAELFLVNERVSLD